MKTSLAQVFERGITQDQVILMAARASRTENQDAIDTAIVGMLADPKEVLCHTLSMRWQMILPHLYDEMTVCPYVHAGTCWYSRSSFSAIQSY